MKTYVRPQVGAQRTANGVKATSKRGGRKRSARLPLEMDALAGATDPGGLRVAILDRDSGFLVVLAKRLEQAGWRHQVLPCSITAKALAVIEADVLILDPAVLGSRRWTWLGRLCEQRPDIRIVVCQASSTVAERVRGLRLGVDDWLSKPCHPEELLARIEAITHHRDRPQQRSLEPVMLGEVEVRPDQFQAFVGGVSLRLTRREYQLIEMLSHAGNEVLHREHIYECLWGYEMIRNDRSVDVFVHKLRRKLECASPGWRYVHTHFGIGYRLAPEAIESAPVCQLPVLAHSEKVEGSGALLAA